VYFWELFITLQHDIMLQVMCTWRDAAFNEWLLLWRLCEW